MATDTDQERRVSKPSRQRIYLAVALMVAVPGVVLRFVPSHLGHAAEALIFGVAIVGAAFLLSWAAETAQVDISAGLATAVLAFIAVLPEYAVDLVFAWKGGNAVQEHGSGCRAPGSDGESACSLALANMTGANRLLIGIGWSMVVFIAWWQWRRRSERRNTIELDRSHSVELSFLAVATAYSLTLPLKQTITLLDALLLIGLFTAYVLRVSKAPPEEPHLVGPALYLASFSPRNRRVTVVAMLVISAAVILVCAEPFAEALVATGKEFGVSEFLLVQWLAPLASEAPELLVAGLYAWRLKTALALGTLVSAKVNQWTLLVGTLPVVFAIASGSLHGLPIDSTQREELLLTAAQSAFAVAILTSLSVSVREALALFGLFWAQFLLGAIVPDSAHGIERVVVAIVYMALAVVIFVRNRKLLRPLFRDGFRTPYERLSA